MPPKEAAPAGGGGGSKKIFIYELDGYLGKVLGEFAKYKGFAEGETPIISGSLIDPRNKPTWADEVIRKDDLLGLKKALLSSDIIVYDVASTPKEATSALKVLLKYDYAENPEDETDKVLIGVSNLLSWYNNKSPLPAEGEEAAAGDVPVLSSDDAPERKPHDNYKAQVTVENLIINKGNCKKDRLKTYVVWAGLLYGCGEGVLHSLFRCSWLPAEEVAEDALSLRRAWRTEKKLPILGSGANKIPMIHVSDLAGMVLELAKRRPEDIKSVLAVDKGEATLADCVSAVSKALQSGEVINLDPNQYLQFMTDFDEPHVHSLLLQLNMKMTLANGELLGYGEEETTWVSQSGFTENIERVVEEYRQWRNLQPVRVLFFGPPTLTWYPANQDLAAGQLLKAEEKVSLAKDFAEEYQVTCIDLDQLKEEFKPAEPAEGEEPEPEKSLIEMLQLKLQQPVCRNQGYVLNNFPATRADAEALFDCDALPAAEGEEPAEDTEQAEGKPPKAPLPQSVLHLTVNVPDPAVPAPPAEGEEPAPDDTPMAEKIKAAKLEAYTSVIGARLAMLEEEVREKEPDIAEVDTWLTENGLDEEGQQLGCLGLFMTNKAKPEGEAEAPSNGGPGRQVVEQVVNIVTDLELDFIQDKIRLSIGDPRNYDPSKPRREREAKAAALAEAAAAAAAEAKAAEEEASRSAREAKAKLDAERLAKLQEVCVCVCVRAKRHVCMHVCLQTDGNIDRDPFQPMYVCTHRKSETRCCCGRNRCASTSWIMSCRRSRAACRR